jgi:hypothetical protein
MGLCVWAGAVLLAALPINDFTLAWTHSIEKIRWEEDWRVRPAGLEIVEARIRGVGAGMEPPDGAELRQGVWRFRPAIAAQHTVTLARAAGIADYEFCVKGRCRPLAESVSGLAGAEAVALTTCRGNEGDN